MKALTRKQRKALHALAAHRTKHGHPPTVRELASRLGVSLATTEKTLRVLVGKGAITRGNPRSKRTFVPTGRTVMPSSPFRRTCAVGHSFATFTPKPQSCPECGI